MCNNYARNKHAYFEVYFGEMVFYYDSTFLDLVRANNADAVELWEDARKKHIYGMPMLMIG